MSAAVKTALWQAMRNDATLRALLGGVDTNAGCRVYRAFPGEWPEVSDAKPGFIYIDLPTSTRLGYVGEDGNYLIGVVGVDEDTCDDIVDRLDVLLDFHRPNDTAITLSSGALIRTYRTGLDQVDPLDGNKRYLYRLRATSY